MTLIGYCPLCDADVELPHIASCPSMHVSNMAAYLRVSQARVNALLTAAGRPDLHVDFSANIENECRIVKAREHLNQITGWH